MGASVFIEYFKTMFKILCYLKDTSKDIAKGGDLVAEGQKREGSLLFIVFPFCIFRILRGGKCHDDIISLRNNPTHETTWDHSS
jgi:hypothetical protein